MQVREGGAEGEDKKDEIFVEREREREREREMECEKELQKKVEW